jgi:hypothetical protein
MQHASANAQLSAKTGKYEVEYLYRDAGNYKYRAHFVVDQFIDLGKLKEFLFDEVYFVPDLVGLPSLVPCPRNSDDHILHEFVDILPIDDLSVPRSAQKLIADFERNSNLGWFRG